MVPAIARGRLKSPTGIAIDLNGSVLVADTGHGRMVRFGSDGAELASWTDSGDGSGRLKVPYWIALGANRMIYVSDPEATRIEMYAPDGTTVGGWPTGEWHALGLATDPVRQCLVR